MNGLNRAHARIAAALTVFGLALLVQGSLLAFADPPRSDTLQINNTNTVTSLCAFPLTLHEEGALRTTLFFDQNGQVVRVNNNFQGVQSTLTNPANGRSLHYVTAGRDGFTLGRDGDVTVVTAGVRGLVTVPGQGALTGEAGNVTIRLNTDGTMQISRSGYFQDDNFEVACAYLQGTP